MKCKKANAIQTDQEFCIYMCWDSNKTRTKKYIQHIGHLSSFYLMYLYLRLSETSSWSYLQKKKWSNHKHTEEQYTKRKKSNALTLNAHNNPFRWEMCSFLVIFIPSDRFRPTLRAHITSINSSISRFISIYFLVSGANSEKLQPEILTRKFNKRNEWKMFTLLQRGKIKKIKHQTRKKKTNSLSVSAYKSSRLDTFDTANDEYVVVCVCPRLKPKLLARFNLVKCTQFQMICLVTIMTGWKCRVAESTKKKQHVSWTIYPNESQIER